MFLGGWLAEVDLVNLEHGEVAFAVLGRPDLAGQAVAGAQVKAANLAGRDVDVVRAGQVRTVRGAQEAEAVLQDFQGPRPENVLARLGLLAHDGRDDLLLARAGQVFQAEFAAHVHKLADGLGLEVFQIHRHIVVSFSNGLGLGALPPSACVDSGHRLPGSGEGRIGESFSGCSKKGTGHSKMDSVGALACHFAARKFVAGRLGWNCWGWKRRGGELLSTSTQGAV